MRAVAAGSPGQVAWIELDEPALPEGGVVLRSLACGVCTTDVKQIRAGATGHPGRVLGHELVGEVVAAWPGSRWRAGDRVIASPYVPCGDCYYCQRSQPTLCAHLFENGLEPGGLAERVAAPAALAEQGLLPLPPGLELHVAALAEPIGCCVQSVAACGVRPGDSVLVVGDGPMGLMNAAVARAYGARLLIVAGMLPHRLAVAKTHYADAVVDVANADLRTTVADLTEGRGADAVVVAVSSPEAVSSGITGLRPGGVLNAFAGVPPGTAVPIDLHRLHYGQIHLTGSFGLGPAHLHEALRLLSEGQIDVQPLITGVYPFSRSAEAIAHAASQVGLKAVVVF